MTLDIQVRPVRIPFVSIDLRRIPRHVAVMVYVLHPMIVLVRQIIWEMIVRIISALECIVRVRRYAQVMVCVLQSTSANVNLDIH